MTMTVTVVTNFEEIAIREPRPGFFVGDYVSLDGDAVNPIVRQYELTQDIPPAPQSFPLGSLTPLPTEILHAVLSHLDIPSVLNFRSVNRRFSMVVSSSPDFNTVASFPKAMSTVVYMNCRFFSLGHLATCLSVTQCSRCDHFGELLYLVTAERVCWSCWRRFRDFIPKFVRGTGLSAETIDCIPHITVVCGSYGEPRPFTEVNFRGRIFDRRAVVAELEKALAAQESGQVYSDPDPEPERIQLRSPESAAAAASLSKKARMPMAERYIAFLRAPYFDRTVQSFVGGYFCRACIGRGRFYESSRSADDWTFPESIWHEPWRRYTREGFWEHVEKYGKILKNDVEGTFAHDSPQREKQNPDDVQWEMYRYETPLLSGQKNWRDDHPLPFYAAGRATPHNCQ
ncbi:hypothetical protein V8E51_013282 [Hyaloscypha variabilis]